ncbi:hypothetical protein [Carboxylicivirga marina]|uniref:hypothetical protein n=1 Tax=Carboxylicivirga marina TaxID=2800988 RepID=UPI002591AECC|nr:hypothetical protein [uncultured Carboxylicivirga sp.]
MHKGKRIVWTSISVLAFAIFIFSFLMTEFNSKNEFYYSLFNLMWTSGQLAGFSVILATLKYKDFITNKIILTGLISGITAIILKFMHLPWNDYALMISALILIIGVISRLIKKQRKESLNYLKVAWFVIFLIGIVFKMNHYPGVNKILIVSLFILWAIIIIQAYRFENNKTGANKPQ